MDPETAAAWQSAANTVQGAAGVIAQGNLNYSTRNWNEAQLEKQRQWALEDRDYANQYNSPTATMARLKAGGLNPNLVYGHGATTEASPVRSATPGAWNPTAPDFKKIGSGLDAFNDFKMKNAQIDSIKAATQVAEQDRLFKAAQTVGQTIQNDVLGIGRFIKDNTRSIALDQAQANLDKTYTDIGTTAAQGDRITQDRINSVMMRDADLKVKAQQIINMATVNVKDQAQIDLIKQTLTNAGLYEKLQQLQIDMRKQGVNDTDNPILRIFTKWLNDAIGTSAPGSAPMKLFQGKY